ncbi:hypothetical protein ciss_00640 [Carboxydothermus islandicus]|uniref:Essential protein Yae1 N-terminal domain-containing protein n=1 Tax=Carboxydothermus islandicus TaxID=661089 RepID=A0A1L8CZ34_9THEO|nr:hypothetical protein [Carboxydothermus islandicus]GAV24131.1 hypothetical protein ciss_00640 [Carboxydothermus islandicus]
MNSDKFEKGFFEGKKLGYSEGFAEGFEAGYERGLAEGKALGFNDGSLSILTMEEHKLWHEFLTLMKKYGNEITINGPKSLEVKMLLKKLGITLRE